MDIKVGDTVDRKNGSYRFPGRVLSVYVDEYGKAQCVVELAALKVRHIFNYGDLRKITMTDYETLQTAILDALEYMDA